MSKAQSGNDKMSSKQAGRNIEAEKLRPEQEYPVRRLFLRRRLADAAAALDAPEHLVAVPLAKRLAVEERFEAGFIRGMKRSGDGKHRKRRG